MTTEEVFDKITVLANNWHPEHKTVWCTQLYDALNQWKSEFCKQQRELCFYEVFNRPDDFTPEEFEDSILNAPEPI